MRKVALRPREADDEGLKRIIEREGRTQSEIIWEAIRRYRLRVESDRSIAPTGSGERDRYSTADVPEVDLSGPT